MSAWTRQELERIGAADEFELTTDGSAVDAAYRAKYGRYVEPMVAGKARATTLRLVPRPEDAT